MVTGNKPGANLQGAALRTQSGTPWRARGAARAPLFIESRIKTNNKYIQPLQKSSNTFKLILKTFKEHESPWNPLNRKHLEVSAAEPFVPNCLLLGQRRAGWRTHHRQDEAAPERCRIGEPGRQNLAPQLQSTGASLSGGQGAEKHSEVRKHGSYLFVRWQNCSLGEV